MVDISASATLFTPISKVQRSKHLTGIVFGPTKSRRTTWALSTCPEPVFYFAKRGENVEEGLHFCRDRNINRFLFGGTAPLDATCIETTEWALPELARFLQAYDQAVSILRSLSDSGGSIVIDKGKDLRDLYLLANFGTYRPDDINAEREELHTRDPKNHPKPNRHLAAAWGPVQAQWNKFVYASRANDSFDQIIVELEQDEYGANNKPTGRKVLKAGNDLDVPAQFWVQTSVGERIAPNGSKQTTYSGTIVHPERFRRDPGTVDLDVLTFDTVKRKILEEVI